jgi:hypothetical protein
MGKVEPNPDRNGGAKSRWEKWSQIQMGKVEPNPDRNG